MTNPAPIPPRTWPALLAPLGVFLATLALMLATSPRLSIVWDEGFTLGRETRIRMWFRAMADPAKFASSWVPPRMGSELVQPDKVSAPRPDEINTREKLLSARALAWFWPFAREEPHGHPPFYAIESVFFDLFTPDSWSQLTRARVGPIVAFSLAAGAIFGFVGRRWGAWPASLAAGAWVLQPNLFGHGHYATLDGLLSSLWVGAVLAFGAAVETEGRRPRWGYVLLLGVLCGWAADTKLTGWFLPVPFVAWSLHYRDRRGWLTLLVGGLVGVVVLFGFNPCWWYDPAMGVVRFFRSNLTRGRTVPIAVLFLGKVYQTPNESLPWWNTIAWTVMVTPVGFLAFALAGTIRALRRKLGDGPPRFAVVVALQWGMLLALRGMPHTPGHDGVRLFLPAFGMLAILAGIGAAGVSSRRGRALVAAALIEGAASVAVMMPVPLSYFSPIVGGLPGATALGMEPTYFWDSLPPEALDWLAANTPPGRTVVFVTNPTSWNYLRETGQLRVPLWPGDPGRPAWFVMQNRPGAFGETETTMLRDRKPAFTVRKLGVPLLLIYPTKD